jgi:hypothetical protein
MTRDFDVEWDGVVPGAPQQVWDAITVHSAGWQWKIDYEPWVGGTEHGLTDRGMVTRWEPPRHFTTRAPDRDGYNELDYRLEPVEEGTLLRYHHHGVAEADGYELEVAACRAHTDVYYHSLGQYVDHFAGRDPIYVASDAPPASATGRGLATLQRALGCDPTIAVGTSVHLTPTGMDAIDGVVDYLTDAFLGIRTDDALYRFYARDVWGWPVALAHHLFGSDIDGAAARSQWDRWLQQVFAPEEVGQR